MIDAGREPELDDAVAALRELILVGERYRLAAAAFLGVTVSESQVTSYLASRGPMGQNEIAQALRMTTGTTTAVVDRLEHRGLVERGAHPTDRRRTVVSLSAVGEEGLLQTRAWIGSAFSELPARDLTAAAKLLRALAQGLQAHTDDLPTGPPEGIAQSPRRRR